MADCPMPADDNPYRWRLGHRRNMTLRQSRRAEQEARIKAKKLIDLMEDEGKFEPAAVVPGTDEYKAKQALEELAVIAFGKAPLNLKISACKTILEFCKEKPAQKSKLTLDKSEEWLNAVAADMAKDAKD